MLRDTLIKTGLSNRESEVAVLVATGMSNKEVADRLFVTEKTIKFHLTNIYKKMNIRSRAQLIVWCLPHLNFAEKPGINTQPMANVNPIYRSAPIEQSQSGENVTTLATGRAPAIGDNGGGNGNNEGQAFGA